MVADYRILVVNPGSTSTKTALFFGDEKTVAETIRHDARELTRLTRVVDQFDLRLNAIDQWMSRHQIQAEGISCVVGRGAPLRPLRGGSYRITDAMIDDLRSARFSNHASNLGPMLARHLGDRLGVGSLIADPVTVDNFPPVARLSGMPEIERKCRWHALNLREVCRRAAVSKGKTLEALNFIAVHLGGGISVAALKRGKVIDVNDGLLGMGPYSVERAGALPIGPLVELCFSGRYSQTDLLNRLSRESGLASLAGESDLREVEKLIEQGDKRAELAFQGMAYQIAKEIGATAAVLSGDFESIVITGGMAHSHRLVQQIRSHIEFLGSVEVVPGEFEMEALAAAGVRFLTGVEELQDY